MEIRRATIMFSSKKKKDRLAQQQLLMHDIEILEKLIQNSDTEDQQNYDELNEKKTALEDIFKHEAEGAFVRSRAKYKIEGEKPTKMFCALETYNGVQKYVPQLIVVKDDTEKIITEQSEIETEIHDFYRDLFECKDNLIVDDEIDAFLGNGEGAAIPKLSESQKNDMKGTITLEEMTKYLKKTKNNVAPGTTGFTNEFYKFFWRDLKIFVINSVEYSFENNRLSASKSLGIINIIPKGDKDKRYLSNWRPLTLLDTLYKLISGCIAERIKPALNTIIHSDQKGFVAGRYIGEVVRTTNDIIEHAKETNTSGLLLLIDFEKAYDSISFSFINKCMRFFNFCDDMIKWVEILLFNFRAVINHCGNISKSFNIGRGCRQGDPIAAYLFILCIEILAHRLRTDPKVERFSVQEISHLLEIYADDLTLFLNPNSENLRNVIQILDSFRLISGLKISVTKTKAIWFGKDHNSTLRLCPDLNLKWVKEFTLLGINFDNNLSKMESNFEEKISKIEKLLSHWSYRYLTPFGKITIIKSLALSKLSHIALVIPDPSKQMFKKLESILFKFLWCNKSEKVSREDCKLPEKLGGLGMPDVEKFWLAFKFSWLRRLLTSESYWPQIILKQISIIHGSKVTASQLLQFGPSYLCKLGKKLKNKFWSQTLTSTVQVSEGEAFCNPERLMFSSFWHNPLIRRNNKIIRYEDFPELKNVITTLSDFYYPSTNQIMAFDAFQNRYRTNLTNIKYIDIRYVISTALQKLNLPPSRLNCADYPQKPTLIHVALATNKGCSYYYKILTKKQGLKNKISVRENKWHEELQSRFSIIFWHNARKLYASISCNNNFKWLQFQIVRNSLQTNFIVSHFINDVSPLCKYCLNLPEKVSHLFWSCNCVSVFLQEVFQYICSTGLAYIPTRNEFIFGNYKFSTESPQNYLSLIIKKYIWKTKFKTPTPILTINGLKNYLKMCLEELKTIYIVREKASSFDEWLILYFDLCASDIQNAGNSLQAPVLNLLLSPAQPTTTQVSHPQAQLS